MKVVKEGRPQEGWAEEYECTGEGNDGGGCGAVLLVEEGDLSCLYSHARDETTAYLTFSCCQCGVKTDIWDDDRTADCPISHETYLRVKERTKEAAADIADIAKQRSEQRAKLAAAAEPVNEPSVAVEKMSSMPEPTFKEIFMKGGEDSADLVSACYEVHKRLDEGFRCLSLFQEHGSTTPATLHLLELNSEIMKVVMDVALSFGCDVDLTLDDAPQEGRRRIEISRTIDEETDLLE